MADVPVLLTNAVALADGQTGELYGRTNPIDSYEGGNTNKTKVVTITDVAALVSWTGAVVGQVLNSGAQTVYIGGADVTSSNGWPVAAGLREGHGRPGLWAVCATGETSTLIVWDEVV